MKNKNHTRSCFNYCSRVYELKKRFASFKDGRTNPSIDLSIILFVVMFSIMSGLHSFFTMENAVKDGDFNKFFRKTISLSADTIPYALEEIDLEELNDFAVFIVQKARHNESLKKNTIDGLKVVAIDGTDTFTMKSDRYTGDAHKIEHKNKDGEVTSVEYKEKAIGAAYVGEGFSVILKIKRIPKGEGELTAAKKLLDELNKDHFQYCDLIVVDSLYINAPFINKVLINNKDVIIRVKQNNNLIKDAEGLFKNRKPDHVYTDVTPKDEDVKCGTLYDIEIWDEEGFEWSNVNGTLRVLKVKERRKVVNADGEVVEEETNICYYATTMERSILKAFTVWKIAHRRWDEENSVFHWIKTYWNFDRRYNYIPHVIQVMYFLYVIAYNLFHLYINRNLRSYNKKKDTKKDFMRKFYKGLVTLKKYLFNPKTSPG